MAFAHPYFLLLGLAIIIPIIVHLFNFHKFKQVLFTNVKSLEDIVARKKQQNQLYQRLLLLSRCLTILLLALLFAQPYINRSQDAFASQGQNAVVIIVDNSFSMQNIYSKGSMLDACKQKAEDILEQYSDNDVFCLLTSDLEGRHKHFIPKQVFRELLKDVQISPSTTMYSELINTAHHLLSLRNEQSKRVFLLSDFQSSCFDYHNIKENSTVKDFYLPLQAKNIDNVYIDTIILDRNIYLQGQEVDLKVRVRNCSEQDREKIVVKLFIDNQQQSLVNCDIKKNSYVEIPFKVSLNSKGTLEGRVHVIDNPIVYDDDFYFCLNVTDRIKVLSINQNTSNKYLDKLFSNSSEVELQNVMFSNVDFTSLNQYNTIILNGLQSISTGMADQLKRCRDNGVTIVVVPKEDIDLASYNKAMEIMQLPTYAAQINMVVKVSKIDDENKLFEKVFMHIPNNMQMPQANIYYKIASKPNVARQDIIYLSNNDAFLSENTYKSSLGFVFASGFEQKMSDFVNQTIFVPIMWNIVLYSISLQQPYMFLDSKQITDITQLKDKNRQWSLSIESKDHTLRVKPHLVYTDNRLGFELNGQIKKAGIYNLVVKDDTITKIALNYNRNESVLKFLNSKQITKQLQAQNFKNYSVFNDQKMISSYFTESKKGFDFSFVLLALISACIVAEIYLCRKINKS